jgi:hypothetical protein
MMNLNRVPSVDDLKNKHMNRSLSYASVERDEKGQLKPFRKIKVTERLYAAGPAR